MTSSNMMVDPQFSMARILRPYANFETDYQGQDGFIPIMLTEEGQPLDDLAGEPGYSPLLVRGMKVPLGARVLLWLPKVMYLDETLGEILPYAYTFSWRLRNVFDYRETRTPFHFPSQAPGAPGVEGVPPVVAPRVVVPAANHSIIYNSAAPTSTDLAYAPVQRLFVEQIGPYAQTYLQPYLPGGVLLGELAQGVFPALPAFAQDAVMPEYQIFEMRAAGDELLVSIRKQLSPASSASAGAPAWDFTLLTGADYFLSVLLGNGAANLDPQYTAFSGPYPNAGVYVMVGVAP